VGRWTLIGVIAFVAVDIVLIVWAVVAVRTPPHDPPAHSATSLTTPASTATRMSTPKATATSTPVPAAVAPTRVLGALDANTAWRAQTGACPATKASLQLTTDGGKTWKASDAAGPTGASSPLRILVTGSAEASVVALNGQGCAPEFIRTYVAGDNWAAYPDQLNGTWFANPRTASTVHSPNGDVKTPCAAVVGLAVRDSSHAAVLCSDHSVYRTADTGGNWGPALTVPGAVAITDSGDGYVVAAAGAPTCAGVVTSSFNATSGAAKTGGCFASGAPIAGAVALSNGGGTLWAWVGGRIAHSGDGGATWR
jgi:hypothetical protein